MFWLLLATGIGVAFASRMAAMHPFRRAAHLGRALQRDATRSRAADELIALLARYEPRDLRLAAEYAALSLYVAAQLLEAKLPRRALDAMTNVRDAWLSDDQLTTRAEIEGGAHLFLGEHAEVLIALDRYRDLRSDRGLSHDSPGIANLEAHALARLDRPDDALALIGDAPAEGEPDGVITPNQIVRAHAFAAKGDTERATAILRDLKDTYGDDGLRTLFDLEGPATALARQLQVGAPYR